MTRLRCDFSSLNASRLRTGVHVDGECDSCGNLETREHYLYHCPTEGGPDWTTWVLDDEARYPPLARARLAGLRAVLQAVKRRLSAAKQHAADVLSREETISAEEALQLWELLDDVAVRVASTALDSVRRERLAQDARFVTDGGPPLDPYRPSP
ncbi:hypothetical protein JCM8097_007498 [Rhodosporidiobolus ruineniae]